MPVLKRKQERQVVVLKIYSFFITACIQPCLFDYISFAVPFHELHVSRYRPPSLCVHSIPRRCRPQEIGWRPCEDNFWYGSRHHPTRAQHYSWLREDEETHRYAYSTSGRENFEHSCSLWENRHSPWLIRLHGHPGCAKQRYWSSSSWLGNSAKCKH